VVFAIRHQEKERAIGVEHIAAVSNADGHRGPSPFCNLLQARLAFEDTRFGFVDFELNCGTGRDEI